MKIYSDANEDKEKYNTLSKIGADKKDISKVINKEVMMFYILPFIVGGIHSFFAIKVLSDFMSENLFSFYLISLLVCILIFGLLAVLSINSFKKIIKIR
ncbi:ABC transporter permease [uncultured Clostridium sp.]|uniref:FtsX-like permease family protein n=1 Tax=uncultured Clostridium sp. TaxID=59620 RepID=UPI0025CC4ABF|nr:ABC transporter permease [uncultured Clostridium sp.]